MRTTPFRLRPATARDFRAIRDLIRQVRINPWGLEWRRFIIAVDERDQVIGCGQLKPHGDSTIELASIAVAPPHRHQGVARALIDRLLAEAPRPVYLTARSRLVPLYAKWGFREIEIAEMPPYYRRMARLMRLLIRALRMRDRFVVMMLK